MISIQPELRYKEFLSVVKTVYLQKNSKINLFDIYAKAFF